VAAAMTLFLCSLAGIPATAGFIGKVDAFVVAWRGGLWWLVLLALVFSLVAMAFYMRVVLTMWFGKKPADGTADGADDAEAPATQATIDRVPISLAILMGLCAAGTLVAGLYPGFLTHVASLAGQLLR